MNSETSIIHYLFHPLVPIVIYLFMAITTLHTEIPILVRFHAESLTLAATVLLSIIYFFSNKETISYNHPLISSLILGFIFIVSPLISSLVHQEPLSVLQNDEYKTLFKMILFSPFMFWFLTQRRYQNSLLNSIIIFYVFYGFYFLYRFLVLHEVRDFDLRPLLNIRNGDANFLCTFFSMMIPLPLLQSQKAYLQKQKIKALLFSVVGLFFLLCAYLTESRMGLIASVIGIFYLLTRPVWHIQRGILVSIFIILGSLFIGLNGDRLLTRFSEIQDKSNIDRILTLKNGWLVFQDNPIVGSGIHQAKNYFYQNTQYPSFQKEFRQLDVHNTFLKIAAELGIIGFIFFMFFFFWPWRESLQKKSLDRYFLLSSLIILTISSLTIGIPYKDLFALHIFVIAALANSSTEEASP